MFALEYAALFDVYNKGLAALGLPLFLGGTSNHFRIEALRDIGFWDAYNVTEDADLGLRLARAGYAVRTFDSHTLEEAPATFRRAGETAHALVQGLDADGDRALPPSRAASSPISARAARWPCSPCSRADCWVLCSGRS